MKRKGRREGGGRGTEKDMRKRMKKERDRDLEPFKLIFWF